MPTYKLAAEIETQVSEHTTAPARQKVFCAAIVLIPLVALLTTFPISRTDWFVRRTSDFYMVNLGYGLTLHDSDCAVVVYGDSSALTGVDPAVIESETGLKTCNIAEYGGVFWADRLMVPDHYLLQNKRPKFMVMAFAPWNLAPYDDWPKVISFEAILLRMRFFPTRETAVALLRHPEQTFDFMTRMMRMGLSAAACKELPREKLQLRQDHNGLMPLSGPEMHTCPNQPPQYHAPDPKWVAWMRQQYGAQGTHVIVDVTPVPICEPTYPYYSGRLGGYLDNGLERWPMSLFLPDSHFTPPGVRRLSENIAQQIRAATRN